MDFIDVCRVCLKNSLQYIDLDTPFEQDDDNRKKQEYGDTQSNPFTYWDCFRLCTRLEITEYYDNINGISAPQSLCDTCAIELRITYDFLRKARRAHEILQDAILETKVEINENEWRNDYESAKQHLGEDCKNKRNYTTDDEADVKQVETDGMNEHSDDNTRERLLHTQQAEDEFELNTVAASSTSSFDPLSLLQEQNIKAEGAITKVNIKGDVKTSKKAKRRDGSTKIPSNGKSVKTTSTSIEPKRREGPNEETSKIKSINKKIFLCHACPLIYRDAHTFRQHTLAHEGKRKRKLTCEQCGKKFFSTNALQLHAKIHEANRKPTFHCDKCDKSFFHSGSLYLHKQYHSEQRIECTICGKRYVRQYDLNVHSRSHSGDLPYKCLKCDRAFTLVGHLNKHLKNHHDGYRYKCDVCGKEYNAQTTLSQHYRKHTGMPFKCSICDKEFITNYKIRRHIGGVHKVEKSEELDQFIIKVKIKKDYLWQTKASLLTINTNDI